MESCGAAQPTDTTQAWNSPSTSLHFLVRQLSFFFPKTIMEPIVNKKTAAVRALWLEMSQPPLQSLKSVVIGIF